MRYQVRLENTNETLAVTESLDNAIATAKTFYKQDAEQGITDKWYNVFDTVALTTIPV